MIIVLLPQYNAPPLTLSRQGDVLTVNGDMLDFSDLPEGAFYPPEAITNRHIPLGARREGGRIHVSVVLPYDDPAAPRSVTHPAPLDLTADGPVALPVTPAPTIEEMPHADQ